DGDLQGREALPGGGVELGSLGREDGDVLAQGAEHQRLVGGHGPGGDHADGLVAHLPAVAEGAVDHAAAPVRGEPRISGSASRTPVAISRRRAVRVRPSARSTVKRRSPSTDGSAARAETTSPVTPRPPYWRTSARPRARYSAGGVPSLPSRAWMPSAGALRGVPESITTTLRRERASISAPLSPAAPPPSTATSTGIVGRWSVEVCRPVMVMGRPLDAGPPAEGMRRP